MITHYFLLATTATAALALTACAPQEHEEPKPKPLVDVRVVRVEMAEVKVSVHAPATIFAREMANVAPRLAGPITALSVRKGDRVSAGQLIARLEDRDVAAQKQEAEAALADAEATLQKITAGTLPTDVERGRGQVAVAEAALAQARRFNDRRAQLYEQGAIPQRDLQVSQTELAQAKTNYDVAIKSQDLLLNQSRDKDIAIAKSRVDQAKARVANAGAQLEFTKIHSPLSGAVTEQFLYPGDMARPDAPIFTIMDLSTAVARAQSPESESTLIRKGQACEFAPSDQPGKTYAGRVSVVNQVVDPARRTVEVWCEILNPQYALRGGAFGSASVVVRSVPRSLVVPEAAVQFSKGRRKGFAMVMTDKRIAAKREVEIGELTGGKAQVLKGLSEGETVIIEAGYGLPDGAEVKLAGEKEKDERKEEEKEYSPKEPEK